MGSHKRGSGVDKDKGMVFPEELWSQEQFGKGRFLASNDLGRQKRWKQGGNNADLLRSLFARNAQIAADIAECFPAALWLDLELQPFQAWFLTCKKKKKPKKPETQTNGIVIVPSVVPAGRTRTPTPSPCIKLRSWLDLVQMNAFGEF